MSDKVTKEIIYAKLEEIRMLSELIRDIHHDCVFSIKNPGKQYPGCILPEVPRPAVANYGEPDKIKPAQVLVSLRDLASRVEEIIGDYAKFYEL